MIATLMLAGALELVENARALLPDNVELTGRIVQRSKKGIPIAEKDYVLKRENGETSLNFDIDELGTDITWSDVTLDYLWWNDVTELDEEESVNGQNCAVVLLKKGERTVKVWIDKKTGALLQAEELKDGEPVRRLWGTRIKKFGDRWMANVMEVETIGSGHRTKIIVETLK